MGKLLDKLLRREKHTLEVCSAVVAAAGGSERMGGENKILLPLEGIPVLARTLAALQSASRVTEIVVAVREADLLIAAELCRVYGITKPVKIVRGGATRTESVLMAALECREDARIIAVHDGARPLAEPELIDRVIELALKTNAAAPAVMVKDTIKTVRDGAVESTLERDALRAVQTPQAFDAQLLRAALQSAVELGLSPTDDCAAVERLGKEVRLTDGSYENIKITTPEDMAIAAALLRRREGRL